MAKVHMAIEPLADSPTALEWVAMQMPQATEAQRARLKHLTAADMRRAHIVAMEAAWGTERGGTSAEGSVGEDGITMVRAQQRKLARQLARASPQREKECLAQDAAGGRPEPSVGGREGREPEAGRQQGAGQAAGR